MAILPRLRSVYLPVWFAFCFHRISIESCSLTTPTNIYTHSLERSALNRFIHNKHDILIAFEEFLLEITLFLMFM